MFVSPGPIIFEVAGFGLHWYGLLIGLGILFVLWWGIRGFQRRGFDPDALYDLGFWTVLFGVLGARLYYVIFQWEFYIGHPFEILSVWKGGLAIHGALIGGFLAFFFFARRKKMPWLAYLDILAPAVLVAQALGRWGNFFNNEAFGGPTSLPWKMYIPESFRPNGLESVEYFHPTFFYESLWNLLGFAALAWLSGKLLKKDGQKTGTIFFCYLAWYSFGRFFIESLRLDSLMIGPFRIAQVMSILLFVIGLAGMLYDSRVSLSFLRRAK